MRVSGHGQRTDLDRRVSRLTVWASEQDLTVRQVVVEVGSGLDVYARTPQGDAA